MSKAGRGAGPQPVDPNEQISRKLRQFYDGVREQDIPDKFLDLLEKLDEAERKMASDTNESTATADKNERS